MEKNDWDEFLFYIVVLFTFPFSLVLLVKKSKERKKLEVELIEKGIPEAKGKPLSTLQSIKYVSRTY